MLLLEWVLLAELLILALAGLLYLVSTKPDEDQDGEKLYRILRIFWRTILEKKSFFDLQPAVSELPDSSSAMRPIIKPKKESTFVLPVLVVPESSCDQVVGFEEDTVKMLVSTPAGSGQTNKAVIQLLVEVLQLQPHQVQLIRGHYGVRKHVQITGLNKEGVTKKLAAFL